MIIIILKIKKVNSVSWIDGYRDANGHISKPIMQFGCSRSAFVDTSHSRVLLLMRSWAATQTLLFFGIFVRVGSYGFVLSGSYTWFSMGCMLGIFVLTYFTGTTGSVEFVQESFAHRRHCCVGKRLVDTIQDIQAVSCRKQHFGGLKFNKQKQDSKTEKLQTLNWKVFNIEHPNVVAKNQIKSRQFPNSVYAYLSESGFHNVVGEHVSGEKRSWCHYSFPFIFTTFHILLKHYSPSLCFKKKNKNTIKLLTVSCAERKCLINQILNWHRRLKKLIHQKSPKLHAKYWGCLFLLWLCSCRWMVLFHVKAWQDLRLWGELFTLEALCL